MNNTLVTLRALKNLGCIPEHWPLPLSQAFGFTERDDWDEEEELIIPRQPTPDRPCQPPFPCTEENIPKLKTGLRSSFPPAHSTPRQPDGQDVRSLHKDSCGPQCQTYCCPQTHSDPPTLEGAGEEGFGQRHEAGDHREGSHGSSQYLAVKNGHGSKEIRQA